MSDFRARPDALIATIADRQHGVISTAQLYGIGLDKDQILYRTRVGRLHRIHRGVYAIGRRGLTLQGRLMAAALACGDGAVVSHRSAASLWGLMTNRPGPVDISVASDAGRRKRKGVRMHRSSTLVSDQITFRSGIPVTTAARTIADLRRVVSAPEYRHAVRQADALGLSAGLDLADDGTRSELEFLFLQLCKKNDIPTPQVNVQVGAFVADFLWARQRLIVETDGYRYHRGRAAFEADRERDITLRAQGYDVLRLTYRQVTSQPRETASVIRRTLARNSDYVRVSRQGRH